MRKLRRTKGQLIGSGTMIVALALLLVGMPGVAGASPLWTSVPKPFGCGPGGKIVPDNSCLKHTGFKPNAGKGLYGPWWSQRRNKAGNCTAYVAYRLMRNGASNFLMPRRGSAVYWREHAERAFGSKAVNNRPAVGSVAWWGGNSAKRSGITWAGHVAYVEKVSANGKAIFVSESHWNRGSSRTVIRKGPRGWPVDAFLHIQDKPATPPKSESKPSTPQTPTTTPPASPVSAPPKPKPTPKPTSPSKPKPKPSVSISKGSSAQGMPGCKSIYCRYIAVSFKNFPSGSHSIRCRASHGSEGGYYTYTRSGTSNSSAYCYYGFPGHIVWVTVDGVSSNKIVW